MKYFLFVFLAVSSISLHGQDTCYFDSNLNPVCSIEDASFYRIITRYKSDSNRVTEKYYYSSGKIKSWNPYGYYPRHILHGKQLEFYEDGKKLSEIDYEYGKINGLRKSWYENGQLRRKDSFTMDTLITGKCFSSAGADTTYFEYQILPSFPGGESARQKFLAENVIYPAYARENGIQQTVYISFFIETDGSISVIRVVYGSKILTDEAIRVIKSMPNWNPGYNEGKLIRVKINMPIRFIVVE